jgi:hypothetical protein
MPFVGEYLAAHDQVNVTITSGLRNCRGCLQKFVATLALRDGSVVVQKSRTAGGYYVLHTKVAPHTRFDPKYGDHVGQNFRPGARGKQSA